MTPTPLTAGELLALTQLQSDTNRKERLMAQDLQGIWTEGALHPQRSAAS